jgi:hypothetical protein
MLLSELIQLHLCDRFGKYCAHGMRSRHVCVRALPSRVSALQRTIVQQIIVVAGPQY